MNDTLLLGNGIIRAQNKELMFPGSLSWEDLLNEFADQAKVKISNIQNKPLPLVFEEIRLKSITQDDKGGQLTYKLTNLLLQIPRNYLVDIYSSISKHMLTTNYDSTISSGRGYRGITKQLFPSINEKYHSLFRHEAYIGRNIWSIHGHIRNPRSILLGHTQYAKYMGQVKDYLYKGIRFSNFKNKFQSTLLAKNPDFKFDETGKIFSWIDLYLRDHIHVVGFSMDFCENILWWLTIEKMILKNKYPKNIGGITFYTVSILKNKKSLKELNVMEALNEFGVEIIEIESETYAKGYEKIADILKPDIVSRCRNDDNAYINKNI
jgi:hypothetical protein